MNKTLDYYVIMCNDYYIAISPKYIIDKWGTNPLNIVSKKLNDAYRIQTLELAKTYKDNLEMITSLNLTITHITLNIDIIEDL